MNLAALGLFALAWLCTYLVHSTLLLGGTWAVLAHVRRVPVRWRDRLWKLALVGGLMTASVQVGSGLEPFGGRVHLMSEESSALFSEGSETNGAGTVTPATAHLDTFPTDGGGTLEGSGSEAPRILRRPLTRTTDKTTRSFSGAPAVAATVEGPRPEPNAEASPQTALPAASQIETGATKFLRTPGGPWRSWLSILWVLGAVTGLLTFATAMRRLQRHLRGRVELDDGPLRARLDGLMARANVRGRVRLSASPRLAAPITIGFLRREICVPFRALTDLSPIQQEAMLGHELGHAIRRDPAWLGFCWFLERVLIVQPLNRVARRRLQHNAEILCDDWAVHLTGRRLSLASCLTEVAQWVVGRPQALPAPGMAGSGAPLTQRVERLLSSPPREVTRHERWWLPGGLASLVLMAIAVPGFSASLPPVEHERADVGLERLELSDAPFGLPSTAVDNPFSELLAALGVELSEAEAELRDLKRELASRGSLDRFSDQVAAIEHRVSDLRTRRDQIESFLPRVLEAFEDAAHDSPFNSTVSLPLSDQE